MDYYKKLNVWGDGQLLAFSAFDGNTDFHHGLLLRSVGKSAALEVKLPQAGGAVVFDSAPPLRSELGGDYFVIETARGVTRGAFIDAHHILIEGFCTVLGLSSQVQAYRSGNHTLLGVKSCFKTELADFDFETTFQARRKWLENLALPADCHPTLYKACSQLKTQLCSAEGLMKRRWTTPDRWPHQKMWLWDSVFHAMGLRHIDLAAAKETLEAVFDAQQPDGFIPHMSSPDKVSDITQPPILAFGIELVLECGPDQEFLKRLYPKNAAYLKWVFANRDSDGAGLVEWAIEARENCRSGESGMDNSSRFDGAIQLDAPDFNAYLAQECEIMAKFATQLGLPDTDYWDKQHNRICSLLNERLWSEEKGLYVDYDVENQVHSDVLSSAGFLPLIAGAPTPEMARKIVANLKNPDRFGTAFPVPSISHDSKAYSKDMWRGPTWININVLIARGLDRYGFHDEATALRQRTIAEIEQNYTRFGTFFEFYDDRGECTPPELLRKGVCRPDISPYHQVFMDYGWSGTLYIDLTWR